MNTRCPHATWFDQHLYDTHVVSRANGQTGSMSFLGITFGCNKGDDAVQTLAKFTGNPDISAEKWRNSYAKFGQETGSAVTGRACRNTPTTWIDDRHPLRHDGHNRPSARMFCVEAAVKTADILNKTAAFYEQYNGSLTITHAAMGSRDGLAYFPKQARVGVEYMHLCDENEDEATLASRCNQVALFTADKYVKDYVDPGGNALIDILSVDVEGFDWDVLGLGGANYTLQRTKYLEFEYHEQGNWAKYDLSMATTTLFEEHGFVCYYSGVDKLWRLTNCFQDYFNEHGWSNVACVNPKLNPDLALTMESIFQHQLLE